ncbi:MAG: sporulation protein YqfD [Clostridia bacterium]|nr:sporulation protein YqfD [Clostridia bacterium]
MRHRLIDFLFGICRIQIKGTFCERVVNIARQKGIFVRDITSVDEHTLVISVSCKGAELLLSQYLPEDLSVEVISSTGLHSILKSKRNRLLLVFAPAVIFLLLFLSSQIIWHVNIVDAPKEREAQLLSELKELGVKRGAFKFTIDRGKIKNTMLIQNPDLLWLWVDIRGASAIVKYVERTLPPQVYDENAFYNIYSTHDAVITKIFPTNGIAVVKEGDTVLKGQLLIEGSMAADEEKKNTSTPQVRFSAMYGKKKP